MTEDESPRVLARPDGETIAYRARAGKRPGMLFLCGFKSDMSGTKAQMLDDYARRSGQAFVRFDYFGHGLSSGDFERGTIGRWRDDALAVLDAATDGPQILIGSSMGGWIAMLAALARPDRVAGLVLIAPAFDFVSRLMEPSLSENARAAIARDGRWVVPSDYDPRGYAITRGLLDDGKRHELLPGPIVFDRPVRVLQGMEDPDVPWRHALACVEAIDGGDVRLILVKDGDHRLSRPQDLDLLERTVAELA